MAKSAVTIFHNPVCSTSRQVLGLIREAGVEPDVIDYGRAGWTAVQLRALFKQMGVSAHQALRERGTDAEERGLTKPGVSDEAIIAAMVENPMLVNRPIVASEYGAALCRPVEKVVMLLPPQARKTLNAKGLPAPGA